MSRVDEVAAVIALLAPGWLKARLIHYPGRHEYVDSAEAVRYSFVVCLVAPFALTARDTTSGDLALPSGAYWVSFSVASGEGPPTLRESILAATTLSQIRSQAIAAAIQMHSVDPCATYMNDMDPCWRAMTDRRGALFVAVSTFNGCNRETKDDIAFGDQDPVFRALDRQPPRNLHGVAGPAELSPVLGADYAAPKRRKPDRGLGSAS
jgi:hypothetical protein